MSGWAAWRLSATTLRARSTGHFFDSQGNSSVSELILNGENWIFQDADTRCTSVFSEETGR